MMVTCPVCGKLTVIYWPQFWVYRRGATFYCSENCKMVGQTQDIKLINQVARERRIRKGVDKMSQNKLTREQKGKAVDIAIQGGDPLEYLKKCGAKNPSAAWWYIKKTLATKNPKLLERIPEKIGTVLNESGQVEARVEIADKLPPEAAAEVPVVRPLTKEEKKKIEDQNKPILAEVAEKVPEVEGLKPKLPEDGQGINFMTKQEHKEAHKGIKNEGPSWPLPPGGIYISKDIKVTRFETNFGKFSETETGRIQAEIKTGTSVTVIILKKEEWIQLMFEIEEAMKIFAGGQ